MTHDELLAKIDDIEYISKAREMHVPLFQCIYALRAVVELHKPFLYPEDDKVYCQEDPLHLYPCPTIQAIEKELA